MGRDRDEVIVDQNIKGRKILRIEAFVAIGLGTAILALEIAVCALQADRLGNLSSEQVLSAIAVLFAILAGFATSSAVKGFSNPHTLKRSFILASVLSLLATLFLATILGLFLPYLMDYWDKANSKWLTGFSGQFTHIGLPYVVQTGRINDVDPTETSRILAILKLTAIIGETFLIGATLLCTILSIVNAVKRRGNYQLTATHENRVYYDRK